MDYFAALRLFLHAADEGSFSRAAAAERCKVSTVSRAIQALEQDLGAALFNRSTRRLSLTEAGAAFRERARVIMEELDEARDMVTSLNGTPRGVLKINLPTAFGRRHVLPLLGALLGTHPELAIEATLTDATVDLIAAGADVAVRIGTFADSGLIARRFAPQRRIVCAAPRLMARIGPLAAPPALGRQPCLTLALQQTDSWHFRDQTGWHAVQVAGRLTINDAEALRGAALDGLGIALLPTWLVGEDVREGRLCRLLDAWEADIAPGPARAIAAVYPPKRIVSPKVRAFIDHLAERFGTPPYWDEFDRA
jgi:DNA-binding transcriptional LysR family regulator